MSFAFGSPLFLSTAALAAGVIAVYIFHRRPREQEVSSLLLWQGLIQPGGAGRQREKFRAPWLLALELLAVLLLAFAAARPLLTSPVSGRSVIVVLDNSFSMAAATDSGETFKDRAAIELQRVLTDFDPQRTAFVLASTTPSLVSTGSDDGSGLASALNAWSCTAPSADLPGSIRLALEIGTESSDVVVLTDHDAPEGIEYGPRVRWHAFGSPLANVGITAAARSASGGAVIEVTNASDKPANRLLSVEQEQGVVSSREITIQANSTSRLSVPVAADAEITIRLSPSDALTIDDTVRLLPEDHRPVSVAIRTNSDQLRAAAERWISADPMVASAMVSQPELMITDDEEPVPPGVWTVRLLRPQAGTARPYSGPFTINREHELAEGLDLSGLIWSVDLDDEPSELASPGLMSLAPIVVLASRTVVEQRRFTDGSREVRLHIDPQGSNLTSQIAWPVLLSNAARLRSNARPGPAARNTRVGTPVRINAPFGSTDPIIVSDPGGSEQTIRSSSADFTPTDSGVHTVRIGTSEYAFVANPFDARESDLGQASTVTHDARVPGVEDASITTRNFAWLCAIVAAMVLAAHGLAVSLIYARGGSV